MKKIKIFKEKKKSPNTWIWILFIEYYKQEFQLE